MPMVQIRNVPEELNRELKARAALAGMSVSEYLLMELRRSLERPTRQELLKRLTRRVPERPRPPPADAVRTERNRR
jgi:antitoxin FitA